MKILFVIPNYEPAWAAGGTVTATSQLCRSLSRRGVDVTVYATDADGAGGRLAVPVGVPFDVSGVTTWYFRCDFGVKKAFYSSDLQSKTARTMRQFDIIHVASIWQLIGSYVLNEARKQGIPCIIAPHSSLMRFAFYSVGASMRKRLYWTFVAKRALRNATCLQFLCQGEREESNVFCCGIPSFIVPNGIDSDLIRRDLLKGVGLRKKLGISEAALVLLFLGRIHPKKQIELILKSLPSISRHRKDIAVIVAGPVEDELYFEKLRSLSRDLQIDSQVRWCGAIGHGQTIDYYSASDIMVLPSMVEGISMALTEAMSCSVPLLISKRVANYYEIGDDNAGCITEPNFEATKNGLLKMCTDDELLRHLSQNARTTAVRRYDINRVGALMATAFEDILRGRQSTELMWQ